MRPRHILNPYLEVCTRHSFSSVLISILFTDWVKPKAKPPPGFGLVETHPNGFVHHLPRRGRALHLVWSVHDYMTQEKEKMKGHRLNANFFFFSLLGQKASWNGEGAQCFIFIHYFHYFFHFVVGV